MAHSLGNPKVLLVGAGWVASNAYEPALQTLGLPFDQIDTNQTHTAVWRIRDWLEGLDPAAEPLVILAVPNFCRAELVESIAAFNVRVIGEKPLARPHEAKKLRLLNPKFIYFQSTPFRFRADVQEFIASARSIGPIKQFRLRWRRRNGIPRPGSWYTTFDLSGGGSLTDLGPHLIDVMIEVLGCQEMCIADSAFSDFQALDRAQSASWFDAPRNSATRIPTIDVEVASCVILQSLNSATTVEIEANWSSNSESDSTSLFAEGETGHVELDTLFGYAPGKSNSTLTLAKFGSSLQTKTFNLQRSPSSDFSKLIETALAAKQSDWQRSLHGLSILADAYKSKSGN
jgi:predicted dehydrogenase